MNTGEIQTRKCPKCGNGLVPIIYGMVDQATANDPSVMIGGCLIDGTEPHAGCRSCGWQGFPGGRSYKTSFTKPKLVQLSDDPDDTGVREVTFDVLSAKPEELMVWSAGLFEARLELIHRGLMSVEALEELEFENEHWESMPFEQKEATIAYIDSETSEVLAVAMFFSHKKWHMFSYAKFGLDDWDTASSQTDFTQLVVSWKRASLESWEIKTLSTSTSPEGDSSKETWGSPVIEAVWLNQKVSRDLLEEQGQQYARPILWPWWFEPSEAFNW